MIPEQFSGSNPSLHASIKRDFVVLLSNQFPDLIAITVGSLTPIKATNRLRRNFTPLIETKFRIQNSKFA